MDKVSLKNCPFCGSDDIDPKGVLYRDIKTKKKRTSPQCMTCGASTTSIKQWNTRKFTVYAKHYDENKKLIREEMKTYSTQDLLGCVCMLSGFSTKKGCVTMIKDEPMDIIKGEMICKKKKSH